MIWYLKGADGIAGYEHSTNPSYMYLTNKGTEYPSSTQILSPLLTSRGANPTYAPSTIHKTLWLFVTHSNIPPIALLNCSVVLPNISSKIIIRLAWSACLRSLRETCLCIWSIRLGLGYKLRHFMFVDTLLARNLKEHPREQRYHRIGDGLLDVFAYCIRTQEAVK